LNLAYRRFIYVILFLLITYITIFFDIPFLRQITGFIFLTLLPGVLILQILKLDNIDAIEKILFSVGLSISFLMFTGFFINIAYPIIGISEPISIIPLIFTINTIILIFMNIIALIMCNNNYEKNTAADPTQIIDFENDIGKILSPLPLILFLILLLSILGALAVRYYESSIFSMLHIALIALLVGLIGLDRLVPKRLYPLVVYVIGAALLLNLTLTSPYLNDIDIHYEYYFHKIVQSNSYWDPASHAHNCNAMLSTVMLPTIYSTILKIDAIWIYKVVFSLIFSMVPVGLFQIIKKQIGDKNAFLSAFFFMSFFAFFEVMTWLPRQEISELFVVLIMLLMIDNKIENLKKSILIVIFIPSLVVSHYATTYIFLFFLFLTFTFVYARRTTNTILTIKFFALSIVMAFSWYIYVSVSSIFNSLVYILDHLYTSIYTEMFSPGTMDPDILRAFGTEISELSFWHAAGHYWQILTQILIVIGILFTIFKYKEMKFHQEYFLFSLASMVLILMCVVLPYFASYLLMYRMYHLALLFLSPFCIIGTEAILKITSRLFKVNFLSTYEIKCLVLLIILIPYFLFNTGFIFEATEHPENLQLNIDQENKHFGEISYFNWSYFIAAPIPEQDVVSCKWLSNKTDDILIFVDEQRRCEVVGYALIWNISELTPTTPEDNYIFLGYQNVKEGILQVLDPEAVHTTITYNMTEISPPLVSRNKIYTNNVSEIYR